MEKLLIRFKSIADVRSFVDISNNFASSVLLTVDNYSVDGKSIMGIFSLDLNRTVTAVLEGDDCALLSEALSDFAERKS